MTGAGSLSELRHHPGRFGAVIVAIALSIAFMTVTQVFVTTEGEGIAHAVLRWAAKADTVAEITSADDKGLPDAAAMESGQKAVEGLPEVADVSRLFAGTAGISQGEASTEASWYVITNPALRWYTLSEGAEAAGPRDIVISGVLAKRLGVGVGDTVTFSPLDRSDTYTVTGLADEPSSVGLPVFLHPDWLSDLPAGKVLGHKLLIRGAEGSNPATLTERVTAAITSAGIPAEEAIVDSSKDLRAEKMEEVAGTLNLTGTLLMVFGVIALLVGAIIITNTFAILVAQRRRQVGLMRAIGASRGQVWRRFTGEAILLGLLGSVLGMVVGIGIAWAISTWVTRSAVFGMVMPVKQLVLIGLAGVLATVLASLPPIRQAMHVPPLEALSPAGAKSAEKRHDMLRLVACLIIGMVGATMAGLAVTRDSNNLVLAVIAGALIALAVLFSAILYVPALLHGAAWLLRSAGPRATMAATNAARNPGRAAATAVALMLAVGLVTTLLVGTASIKETMTRALDRRAPVDIYVGAAVELAGDGTVPSNQAFSSNDLAAVTAVRGVRQGVLLQGGFVQLELEEDRKATVRMLAMPPEATSLLKSSPVVADDEIMVSVPDAKTRKLTDGSRVTVIGESKARRPMTVRISPYVEVGATIVSAQALVTLVPRAQAIGMWAALGDGADPLGVVQDVTKVVKTIDDRATVGGGLPMKVNLTRVLDMVLLVIIGMLGVAVLIALVGVGNTLGLSVLERTRESALLRALGLQSAGLRAMLRVEAIVLALVGTLVGILAGTFFGWLGARAATRQMNIETLNFVFPWWQVLAVVLVATVAAVLASVLPGRKAATAAPVDALADVG